MGLLNGFKRAFNAFFNKDPTYEWKDIGPSYSSRPDRVRFSRGNEKSIITAVYNRIATDTAQITFEHVRVDKEGRYTDDINSGLFSCLTLEANIDQTGRAFIQDVVMSMLDEGCVAIVPTDYRTTTNTKYGPYSDILTMRTAKILEWFPESVRVRVWNQNSGQKEDIKIPKSMVAIIENPFYSVINEPSSTMQRLVKKLNMLDTIDEQTASGKLDLIIQLPYAVKNQMRRDQAELRRKDIEMQLAGSKYGIAYTDATEHITQLNRPLENNMMSQIEYLTNLLYSQLGITQQVLDGSASDAVMLNYYNRTIEPIASAICDEIKRKFLTKTARTRGESIKFFRDPFKLTPATQIAELSDKLTRNEIATKNEMRQLIGWKPSNDPKADELRNSNLSQSNEEIKKEEQEGSPTEEAKESSESNETESIVQGLLDKS